MSGLIYLPIKRENRSYRSDKIKTIIMHLDISHCKQLGLTKLYQWRT